MFSEDYLLRNVQVRGEVSNCKYHASGHIYFTLKDASGTLSCVMFAGRRRGLSFPMQNGDQVVAAGSIEVFERAGVYQLYASHIVRDGNWLSVLRCSKKGCWSRACLMRATSAPFPAISEHWVW